MHVGTRLTGSGRGREMTRDGLGAGTVRAQSKLSQLVEQRLRLDQVARVEALGEPAVDRGEEVARLGALALVAPQAREARRSAQLERASALLAGDGEGAVLTMPIYSRCQSRAQKPARGS